LKAAAAGPFFPDWEFQTLFGIERQVLAEVANRWPDVDPAKDVELAVVGSMNHLLGYPHGYSLEGLVGHGPEAIRAVLGKVLAE
jgi:hypothetical protein